MTGSIGSPARFAEARGSPLPDFFGALLEELLDNGPTNNARLVRIVADIGSDKSEKVKETWGNPDQFLTSDLMAQLACNGYVTKAPTPPWLADARGASAPSSSPVCVWCHSPPRWPQPPPRHAVWEKEGTGSPLAVPRGLTASRRTVSVGVTAARVRACHRPIQVTTAT